eukprot:8841698-Alexandrium_andersonii.AAC.1
MHTHTHTHPSHPSHPLPNCSNKHCADRSTAGADPHPHPARSQLKRSFVTARRPSPRSLRISPNTCGRRAGSDKTKPRAKAFTVGS